MMKLAVAVEAKAVEAIVTFSNEDGMVAEVFMGEEVNGNAFRARLVDSEAGLIVTLISAPSLEVAKAWALASVEGK